VADHEEEARDLCTWCLRAAGWAVDPVPDGLAALLRIESEVQPDVIVVDLALPLIDGVEILRIVRGSARMKDVPVVVLSTGRSEDAEAAARAAACDELLRKPCTPDRLLAAVRHLSAGALLGALAACGVGLTCL
jgi:DNA-binding response OmpR family regulator